MFRETSLEFYGIKAAPVRELINVELPVVEVSESRTDYIFLLEDNTYLHFEFQTTYNKDDIIRFANYDLRLYERDGRNITTVVIYTAAVKEADTALNIGSMRYEPQRVMMVQYDGNRIYADIQSKLDTGQSLTDHDVLNLIFLPLMGNNIPKEELAAQSIKMAQAIPDKNKRDTCIASIIAFASKYLDRSRFDDLLEVLKMTDLATMLVDSMVEDAEHNKAIEIAKKALKKGSAIKFISDITGLDESTIEQLEAEMNND